MINVYSRGGRGSLRIPWTVNGRLFALFNVRTKSERQLVHGFMDVVVVETVNIPLQLKTVADNLLSALQKGSFHVFQRGGPQISPKYLLRITLPGSGSVIRADGPPLRIGVRLRTKGAGEFTFTQLQQLAGMLLPMAVVDRKTR